MASPVGCDGRRCRPRAMSFRPGGAAGAGTVAPAAASRRRDRRGVVIHFGGLRAAAASAIRGQHRLVLAGGSRVICPCRAVLFRHQVIRPCSVVLALRWYGLAGRVASSRRILGRMNTSRFFFWREPLRDLKRLPRSGMAPSTGTRSSLSETVSDIRPPRTMMPPSSISTVVLIERLLVEDVGRIGELCAGRGILLLDLQLHRIAFVDVRRDLQNRAHFLALNRRERAGGAADARGRIAVGAGDQRDLLRHLDLGFLVVHRDQRRRRDDVAGAVAAQRLNQGGEIRAGVELKRPTAERRAGLEGRMPT